jgi:hypothetical protein
LGARIRIIDSDRSSTLAALIHGLQLMTQATTRPTRMKARRPPIKMMLATSVASDASIAVASGPSGAAKRKGPATGGASDLS